MKTYKSFADELKLIKSPSNFKRVQIKSSADANEFARQFYFGDLEIYESFFLILLNRANNTIGFVKISQGGLTSTIVDLRLIAKYAVDSLACSVILVHNHPSGNNQPSDDDKSLTSKAIKALGFLDIKVLDHLILTSENYFSFADSGIL